MDINPYEFKDNEAFELANFCKTKQIDALFLLTAWNDHEPENQSPQSVEGLINYWIWRLYPLVNRKNQPITYAKTFALIVCDRVGKE
jgi:hypothetical protein